MFDWFRRTKKTKHGTDTLSGYATNTFTANSTQRAFDVMHNADLLPKLAEKWKNVDSSIAQGHLFEVDQCLKFNLASLRKNSDLVATTTESLGDPHAAADIIITRGSKVLKEYQAKSSNSAVRTINMLRDKKYEGMGRVGADEHFDRAKELMEKRLESPSIKSRELFQDTHDNLDKSIRQEGVVADSTSHRNATDLTDKEFAERYAKQMKQEAVISDMHYSGLKGGQIGAALNGGISAANGVYKLCKNEADVGDVVFETALESAKGFATGYATTALSKGVTYSSARIFGEGASKFLARSNAPVAIAATVVSSSKSMIAYLKGDIEADQMLDEISHNAITGASMFYYGAWGQVIIPIPVVGSLVGAGVGYCIGNLLHQSGLVALGDPKVVKVARERREAIEKICQQGIARARAERIQLQSLIETHFANAVEQYCDGFDAIESASNNGDIDGFLSGLQTINKQFGGNLAFKDFDEFDAKMRSDAPLRL